MPDNNTAANACPDCDAVYGDADNYCRNCGMFLALSRGVTPVPVNSHALDRPRTALPAPVKRAATAVAVGTVLHIGAGLAGKYLLRQAASAMTPSLKPKKRAPAETTAVVDAREPERPRSTVISEALYVRRIWIQRD